MHVTAPDGHVLEVDLGLDWREHDPVQLDVGPVLALPDAVANKVGALYSRAEVRDYLDVDSIRGSGVFTDERLLELAAEHDAGFDRPMFAAQLALVRDLTVNDVAEYGVDADWLAGIKERLGDAAASDTGTGGGPHTGDDAECGADGRAAPVGVGRPPARRRAQPAAAGRWPA